MGNQDPWVVRTDFFHEASWQRVCNLIGAPQVDGGQEFYAYVKYVSDTRYTGMTAQQLVQALPVNYPDFFCFVADRITLTDTEYPVLVINFAPEDFELDTDEQPSISETLTANIQTIRAIPSTIQSIENNLSIANMDFEDFSASVDVDGIFRGF